MTEQLTEEEIKAYEDRAAALAKEYNVSQVHVCVQVTPETLERRACYIKEPNFMTKLTVMGKMVRVDMYVAANELREACIIKEASDPITYGDSPECDPYKLGVISFCFGIIDTYHNILNKKK